jgi:hypothetical protein
VEHSPAHRPRVVAPDDVRACGTCDEAEPAAAVVLRVPSSSAGAENDRRGNDGHSVFLDRVRIDALGGDRVKGALSSSSTSGMATSL